MLHVRREAVNRVPDRLSDDPENASYDRLAVDRGVRVFVNDKDKKSWDIANPDAVKGHEGHHVKVSAKLDEANHSVTIDKLTMMRASKQSGGKH